MRMDNEMNALRMPAQYALVDERGMELIDGGGKIGLNPFKWFENITASVTVTWNGGELARAFQNTWVAWIFKQLSLNLKINLT